MANRALRHYPAVSAVYVNTVKRTLAILGVFFLLLRPVCDVLAAVPAHDEQAGHVHASADQGAGSEHHGGKSPCCASLGDGALVQLSAVGMVRAASAGKLAFAAPWSLARRADIYSKADAQHPPDVFAHRVSFYARSARIRR